MLRVPGIRAVWSLWARIQARQIAAGVVSRRVAISCTTGCSVGDGIWLKAEPSGKYGIQVMPLAVQSWSWGSDERSRRL